jgi:hypothetical protein
MPIGNCTKSHRVFHKQCLLSDKALGEFAIQIYYDPKFSISLESNLTLSHPATFKVAKNFSFNS